MCAPIGLIRFIPQHDACAISETVWLDFPGEFSRIYPSGMRVWGGLSFFFVVLGEWDGHNCMGGFSTRRFLWEDFHDEELPMLGCYFSTIRPQEPTMRDADPIRQEDLTSTLPP